MNGIIENLKMEFIDQHVPSIMTTSVKNVIDTDTKSQRVELKNVYEITSEYKIRSSCRNGEERIILKNAGDEIKNALYGKFKGELLRLQRQIFNDESFEASKTIDNILNNI